MPGGTTTLVDGWQVKLFLDEFFRYWHPKYYVVPRDKNNRFLLELGLTPKQRQQEILTLHFRDYVKGPEPDRGCSGEDVWKFGKKIKNIEVYIKLKVFIVNEQRSAKCLSFHKAEKPLNYPLR